MNFPMLVAIIFKPLLMVEIFIDKEGQIFQNGQNVGQVGVFIFNDPLTDLQKVGGGFIAKGRGYNA